MGWVYVGLRSPAAALWEKGEALCFRKDYCFGNQHTELRTPQHGCCFCGNGGVSSLGVQRGYPDGASPHPFLFPRWLVLAIAMTRFYMEKGTHRGLYKSIQKTLRFFQTFALFEIVHCLIGIVPTSVLVTGVQVSSRIFMVWLITHSIKPIQNEESVVLFLVAWTVTEITRYSFYTFSLLNHLPYFIKWARYNFFIILYPVGVAGELLTIYAALPYVKKSGMFSLRLPNKYNVSFDYYYFLLIIMASYIPLFPQLYFHMLRQRRKVLHGEVIVEKDD
ncbi:very-long-chain (3R)-3-hydroxyacyl-CoA dehydratase 1 [Echinops telfairi]|uniref:Very-long-chain (3R)-3-hydroxyacyl-CoA dehydratase n=1 Tax=Echinops telfairi TaxID=9371 RepID=A0ABM0ZTL8_ECHTE|nr:very-long-chain (3R)-3-hydroxyacyl-CoA dehydratase 1 [Echinops telfairi]